MPIIEAPRGGINRRLKPYDPEMKKRSQCVTLQNLRYKDGVIEPVPGTRRYHGSGLAAGPVTAIMPYYNDQTDQYVLLAACGGSVFKRDEATNEFTAIASGLTPGSIFSSVMRYDELFIASTKDGLKKYLGGNQIETVGTGSTAPGSFRVIVYMKEIDRMFGISDDAIFGQISWCDLSQPEIWDGASVERFKLKDGERVEGADYLYGKLIVFCTYTIWIYYVSGNEENWKLEEAPTAVGCYAPETIKKDGNKIRYLGGSPKHATGIYSFNGSTSDLLTDDITPLLATANKNKLRNACAEMHDDLYTFSIALGGSDFNNYSFDLDLLTTKEDGAPAIYGPHTFAFRSACVLNNRQKNKEFLMGDESDGFIYFENGNTFKSTTGNDGTVIEQDFLSMIHNDDLLDIMKQYNDLSVFVEPTSYFPLSVRAYLSNGEFAEDHTLYPAVVSEGFAGDFDVHEQRIKGVPSLYELKKYLGLYDRGTAIQIGITNASITNRLKFSAYGYNFTELYKTERAQSYAPAP